MNRRQRWTGAMVAAASLCGALAMAPARAALAQGAGYNDTDDAGAPAWHHRERARHDWVHAALALPTLSAEQRATIEQLEATRRAAMLPVRQADASLLTLLAQQVEAGAVDPQSIATAAQAKQAAALSARATQEDVQQRLHGVLNPAQRAQLVDALEARMPPADAGAPGGHARWDRIAAHLGLTPTQEQQIRSNLMPLRAHDAGHDGEGLREAHRAWLESFRGDSFDAKSGAAARRPDGHVDRTVAFVEAAATVLTAQQRAQLAEHLRRRAAHESRNG